MFMNCFCISPLAAATTLALVSNPVTAPVATVGIGTYILGILVGFVSVIAGYKFIKK